MKSSELLDKNFELLEKIIKYNGIEKFDIGNTKLRLMASHPFKYLRGTAERYFDIFFETLKYTSKEFSYVFKDKNLQTTCTNDTHVGNFGFTGKNSIFITNDFDEYMIGNPFLDILRFTSSMKFFIDDINHKISSNNLEIKTLKHFKSEIKKLKKSEILNIIENNQLFDEAIKMDLVELEKMKKENLKEYFSSILDEALSNRVQIDKYLEFEELEDVFLESYFKAVQKQEEIVFEKDSKMYKFFSKSKEKQKRRNQLAKYTKETSQNGLVFNFENEKLIDLNSSKKSKVLKALDVKLNKNFLIKDIAKRKTAGVGSSHLDRYYVLVKSKNCDEYLLLEMKEQLKPVSLNFKKSFKKYLDIDLKSFENTTPAKIHKHGVKKVLGDKFDENIEDIIYKEKSYILKTHFDSKQGFDEEKIFKYSKKQKDIKKFLKEYIVSCAKALASSHLKGVEKIKEFKSSMKKYQNDEKLYVFLKTMSKNMTNMIFEDYLLFSKEFYMYKGYIKANIKSKLELNDTKIEYIRGVLKQIIYSSFYLKLLASKQKDEYRKLYNLIDTKKYKVSGSTLEQYYEEKKEFKIFIIELVKIYLKKEEPFLENKVRHTLELSFQEKLKQLAFKNFFE